MKSHLLAAVLSLAAIVPVATAYAASKPTIILLHGAFQDGQGMWSKVKPEMEAKGDTVIDLAHFHH